MTTIDIKKTITDAMKYASKIWQFINIHMSMAAHCFINVNEGEYSERHGGFKEFDEVWQQDLFVRHLSPWENPLNDTIFYSMLPSWFISRDISDSKSKVTSLMISTFSDFDVNDRCYLPTIPIINVWNSGGEIGSPSTVYEYHDTDPVNKIVVRHHFSGYSFVDNAFWVKDVEQWSERRRNGSLIRGGITDTISDVYLGASNEDTYTYVGTSFLVAQRNIMHDNICVGGLYFD